LINRRRIVISRRLTAAFILAPLSGSASHRPMQVRAASRSHNLKKPCERPRRRANGTPIDWRTTRSPTDARFGQTRRPAGASSIRCRLGARQETRFTRQSRWVHASIGQRHADVQSLKSYCSRRLCLTIHLPSSFTLSRRLNISSVTPPARPRKSQSLSRQEIW
jgi:hypothetical protein